MSPICRPGVNEALLCIVLLSGLCSGLHLYRFIDEPKTWSEAQQYCREKFIDLATMDNMEDVDQLIAAVGSGSSGLVWIGQYDASINSWSYWSDGTEVQFRNWIPGRPRHVGHCGVSFIGNAHAGKWVEYPCDRTFSFVCHYEEKHQLRIKLRVLKPTMDLNDPAVTEAILKLLEKQMKEKGIPAGFKLRWVKKADNTVFQEEKDEL